MPVPISPFRNDASRACHPATTTSRFHTDAAAEEVFVCLDAEPGESFENEARGLFARFAEILAENGLTPRNALCLRLYGDGLHHRRSRLRSLGAEAGLDAAPISFIGQTPLRGGRIALDARLVRGALVAPLEAAGFDGGLMRLKEYAMVFATTPPPTPRASSESPASAVSPGDQTREAFGTMKRFLETRRLAFTPNLLRTWIYVRDIDTHYAAMSEARNAFFRAEGITPATRYFASTGIEGENETPAQAVKIDWLLMAGVRREQIEHMEALDHLPPTHTYGVTFERGTRVRLGDRSHYYLSGTASIDKHGQIEHPGDIRRQTRRMVENVRALLEASEATLDDLKQAVVYLRRPEDAAAATEILGETLPTSLPRVLVRGPVCRPGWLIEMEGVAVNGTGDARFPRFA